MRYKYSGVIQNEYGDVVASANVYVYKAGTTDEVKVYDKDGNSYTTAPQIQSDNHGYFEFFIDSEDYSPEQLFKVVVSDGAVSWEKDNVKIVDHSTQDIQAMAAAMAMIFGG